MSESYGVGVWSYDFSKLRKTESPVFAASQVDRHGCNMAAVEYALCS